MDPARRAAAQVQSRSSHPGVPRHSRALDASHGGPCGRRREWAAMRAVARPRTAGPCNNSEGPTMTSLFLLGLILLMAGGLGVLLVDWLIKRPDVVAGLVLGSVVVNAVYEDAVPSLVLPGQTRVGVPDVVSALVLS